MPQMMPMYWFFLLIITIMFILMMSSFLFFFYSPMLNKTSPSPLSNRFYWKWQW